MKRSGAIAICVAAGIALVSSIGAAPQVETTAASDGNVASDSPQLNMPPRPKAPGTFRLKVRDRKAAADGQVQAVERTIDWQVSETALIICDMWDDHYCMLAAQRVGVMAPKMNAMLSAARGHGAMVIHAPSGTMDFYADTSFRRRMQAAPFATPRVPLESWCHLDPQREPPMPVVAEPENASDDPVPRERKRMYTRQHPALDIIGYDGVSDRGQEIYNVLVQEGIKNVAIMGVHTNMCVLGRPFGIRQLTKQGFNVALVRDLTDAMYDPRQPPYVSHTRGTELVIEHIERYWCPSVASGDFYEVIPGSADPPFTGAPTGAGTTRRVAAP